MVSPCVGWWLFMMALAADTGHKRSRFSGGLRSARSSSRLCDGATSGHTILESDLVLHG